MERPESWEEEARRQVQYKSDIDRIIAAEKRFLNSEQRQFLGYEKEDIVAYLDTSEVYVKKSKEQIEKLLQNSRKLNVILNAENSETVNMIYIKLANKYKHAFRIVSDEQFTGKIGLVVAKEK